LFSVIWFYFVLQIGLESLIKHTHRRIFFWWGKHAVHHLWIHIYIFILGAFCKSQLGADYPSKHHCGLYV